MRKSKKQRRKRIYEMRNLKKRTAQNKQHIVRHTAAVMTNKIKWRWWWTKKVMKTETTTMMMTTAATVTTIINWVKKFLCLNRVSKKIRIKIKIKNIYDEAICFLSIHFIKKEINEQKAATDRFRLQFVCDRSFVVQWTHKTYFVICTHNSFIFTQQSHLNRTVCSAFRTVHVIFFDLIFFLHTYWKRSFFFSIDLKEITICNISMNLMKQWESNDDDRTDTTTVTKEEV